MIRNEEESPRDFISFVLAVFLGLSTKPAYHISDIWWLTVVRVLPRLDTSYDIADRNMKSSKASTFANSEN